MKKKILLLCVAATVIYLSFPLLGDNVIEQKDPMADSVVVEGFEMETDTAPVEVTVSDGEIIFDDSFFTGETDDVTDDKVSSPDETLRSLRNKDRRWHITEYRIKANDSIWTISREYDVDPELIISINRLDNPDLLKKGTILLVPTTRGIYYTIKAGDTLSDIARKFNQDTCKIAEINNIKGSVIRKGGRIFIPDATSAPDDNTTIAKKNVAKVQTVENKRQNHTGSSAKKSNKKKGSVAKVRFFMPLKGPITSGFGYRSDPFSNSKTKRFHCGIDIGAEIGTPVRAACDGRVIFSGWKGSYGYMVAIAHNNNYITVYAHNSKNLVTAGDVIKKGQKIALSGNTGAVTGPHLHFEIRKGTVPINPKRMLKR